MSFQTTDLCDAHSDHLRVVAPMFKRFGGHARFSGQVVTLKLFEDNSLVRDTLAKPGEGRVLVVDGGGSLRCALVGDQIAELAVKNQWAGIVVYGCIRDSAAIGGMDIGVFARPEGGKESDEKVLYLQKHRITQAETTLELVVDELPFEAGIDPYNQLIDRNSGDNRKKAVLM